MPGQHTFHDRKLPSFEQAEAIQLATDYYGLDGDWQALTGERDLNYRVETTDGSFMFKIGNENDDEDIVGFQVEALRHIASRDPSLPVPRNIPDQDGNSFRRIAGSAGSSNIIRLASYLPGVPAQDAEISYKTLHETGRLAGRLNIALSSYFHHGARKNVHPWDVSNSLRFQPLTDCIKEADGRKAVNAVFERFRASVKPKLDATRHQIIHQDAHPGNVLVDPSDPENIVGLIDFGDMVYGPIVADIAVIADVSVDQLPDLQQTISNVVLGFDSEFELQEDEIDLVFDVVCMRAAMTAAIAASWIEQDPTGPLHIDSYAPYVDAVEQLLSIGHEKGSAELRRVCRFPGHCPRSPEDASDESFENELLGKRHRYMGEKATHFYDRPMHFERAKGAYLYATDGHEYLDCYNNVPQVGHCNPHVVRAIARQAAALNTNTRYLYSSVLEYAERLTSKLAPQLDACIFVNSGSEANDIAWQMAKFATGNTGALLMEDAYHGITEPIREFSPGHPNVQLPSHLQGLIVPDTYRGPFREETPDVAVRYAEDADRAIADLAKEGHEVAAFMIDSALCSSGVPDVPEGYMREVEKRVRAAGGLMICDEVQSGFGRMGQWWGHEHHGMKADIVTMGKPVGNGHPLGVVVTTKEILSQFIDKTGLFSTFGGNTVACAAGNAVLDVIERDELIENGRDVGDYLRDSLRELANTQVLIGDVRGSGMLAGLEFVTNRDNRTPATKETAALLELMRQRHVLVGWEGRDGNILKLRPPLVFRREHVDQLVSALDSVLTELSV